MEKKLFQNKRIKKVLAGENHALAIAGNTLYGWGNCQMGQMGKVLDPVSAEETPVEWSLKPHPFSTKNVIDVFTGKNHSFSLSMNGKRKVFKSWGLNCFKQLGLGNRENTHIPTEVEFFVGKDVKYATGGDNHSIVLLENGEVYVWGRNDRGQCGIINERKETENNQIEREEDNFIIAVPTKLTFDNIIKTESENKEENNNNENNQNSQNANPSEENPSNSNISNKINKIASSMDFSYALDKINNQLYSWGTGDSYVLGTRKEDDSNTPFKIPKEFFKNQIIDNISLGANHVIISTLDPSMQNEKLPELEFDKKKVREEVNKILEQNKPARKKKAALDFIVPEIENKKRERKKVDYTCGRKERKRNTETSNLKKSSGKLNPFEGKKNLEENKNLNENVAKLSNNNEKEAEDNSEDIDMKNLENEKTNGINVVNENENQKEEKDLEVKEENEKKEFNGNLNEIAVENLN